MFSIVLRGFLEWLWSDHNTAEPERPPPRPGHWKVATWFNGRVQGTASGKLLIAWDRGNGRDGEQRVCVTHITDLGVDDKVYRGDAADVVQQSILQVVDDHGPAAATACVRAG